MIWELFQINEKSSVSQNLNSLGILDIQVCEISDLGTIDLWIHVLIFHVSFERYVVVLNEESLVINLILNIRWILSPRQRSMTAIIVEPKKEINERFDDSQELMRFIDGTIDLLFIHSRTTFTSLGNLRKSITFYIERIDDI